MAEGLVSESENIVFQNVLIVLGSSRSRDFAPIANDSEYIRLDTSRDVVVFRTNRELAGDQQVSVIDTVK